MAMLRTQFTIPIYLCIVCVCWVMGYFQENSERERRTIELEARLTQANLQALKMQLQPHFLFNTLNSISSLVHENPDAADDMIASLSQFLRTTLDLSSRDEVPVRTELEFVDRYLEIQQARFGDRLRIRRVIDSSVMEALVPPLMLQPLVENAIRYAIECRENGGTVTIRALSEGNVLRVEIADDGEVFGGVQVLGTGSGIGLSNTKARLQELYGEKHQFKVIPNSPTGACVKIEIPFRLSEPIARSEI
jgi:LytS/YehU family sensor histidine kinase